MVVADDASQQTCVGCGYPVVFVDGNGGECRYVYFEQSFRRNAFGELRIECMDALQDEERIFFQFQLFAFEISFSAFEVKKRQFDFFSGN